jgi:succinate dehydrogenase flavin-adding protein (antitoxin of CptAB toxin-antitoxin module)
MNSSSTSSNSLT